MKLADDAYTIMIFQGVASNPRRLRVRRRVAKAGLVAFAVLFVVQTWGIIQYVAQTGQSKELTALRQEMSQSRERMQEASNDVADIKRRMLAMQALSQKLQTMFGIDADLARSMERHGQGGDEWSDEETPYGGDQGPTGARAAARDVDGTAASPRSISMTAVQKDLTWLNREVARQQRILDQMEMAAGRRVQRWNSTPSIWPVRGSVTSKFGPRISPFTGKKTFHAGVDIGARTGEKILAPAKGSVVAAAYDARMGNFIRLMHGYGIETTYGHLSKRLVKRGQTVTRGEVIGLVGGTGRFSTGPHLHYQIAVNDKVVDPLQYILD